MEKEFFRIDNICKEYPGVKALDQVHISVKRGEIRALVGENGAGKSTLMRILNGNEKMDSGTIFIDGEQVDISNPIKAAKYGISIIFQELNLVEDLSIAENIFAGRLCKRGRVINWKDIYLKAQDLLDRLGFKIDSKTEVKKLSIAGKQMVEIAKALSYDARIILMDEPSATLTKTELEVLFNIIRELKKNDITIIYISHRLEEIFEICDSVSVMRDGKFIGTKLIDDISRNQVVEMMVGRKISQSFPKRNHEVGAEILSVENLMPIDSEKAVSFKLHKGEILGISGLVGAGRTECMRALFGVDYIVSGSVYIKGKKVTIESPGAAKKHGIAFITEDRKEEGLTIDFTVKSNIVMANLKNITLRGLLNIKKENSIAEQFIKLIGIKTPSKEQKVLYLSGGNQQKVVVAKWLNAKFDIIIMDEPTRGIDVGAKQEIYELMNKLVGEGKAVIMISSDLPEVLGMSDRILVMKGGSIVAELSGDGINAVNVMNYAF